MQKLQKDERYQRYLNKYKLADKEPPLKIVQDDHGEYWIIDICLDGIKAREYELNIPSFVTGFKSILDIVDFEPGTYKIELLDGNFKQTYKIIEASIDKQHLKDGLAGTFIKEREFERSQHTASPLYYKVRGIKRLIINGNNLPLKGTLRGMFSHFNVDQIIFKDFNAKEITSIKNGFRCSTFKYIDFSGFHQEAIDNIDQAFENCTKLTELDISNIKLKPTSSINYLCSDCSALKTVSLPKINLIKNCQAEFAFYGCSSLTYVNTQNIYQSNNINMYVMFGCCTSIESIDLSNISINHIKIIAGAFEKCHALKKVQFKPEKKESLTMEEFMDIYEEKYSIVSVTSGQGQAVVFI